MLRKVELAALAGWLIVPTALAQSQTGTVAVETAKLRTCPAISCEKVRTLERGDAFTIETTLEGYHRARLADGTVGWVSVSETSVSGAPAPPAAPEPPAPPSSQAAPAPPPLPPSDKKVKPKDVEKANDGDVSKKAFKHPKGDDPPELGETGYVRRAEIELKSEGGGGGVVTGILLGGAEVKVDEESGDWVRVSAREGVVGYMQREDLRTKAPVKWHSARDEITYQECLGKDCKGKTADKVDKGDTLMEIDRGGPDNAYIFVRMPGDEYGWVPVAFMEEWMEKHD